MLAGGEPKSKTKSESLGIRAMRSTAFGARRREFMRARLSCWVFTVVLVEGVRVKFEEGVVGRERARVERRVVRKREEVVVVVYIFAVVVGMREAILIGWRAVILYKEKKEESKIASKDLMLTTKRRIVGGRGDSVGFSICKAKLSLLLLMLLLLLKIQLSPIEIPLSLYTVNITTRTPKTLIILSYCTILPIISHHQLPHLAFLSTY